MRKLDMIARDEIRPLCRPAYPLVDHHAETPATNRAHPIFLATRGPLLGSGSLLLIAEGVHATTTTSTSMHYYC